MKSNFHYALGCWVLGTLSGPNFKNDIYSTKGVFQIYRYRLRCYSVDALSGILHYLEAICICRKTAKAVALQVVILRSVSFETG